MLEEFDVGGGVLRVTMATKTPNPAPLSTRLTANPTLKNQKQTDKQQQKNGKKEIIIFRHETIYPSFCHPPKDVWISTRIMRLLK